MKFEDLLLDEMLWLPDNIENKHSKTSKLSLVLK